MQYYHVGLAGGGSVIMHCALQEERRPLRFTSMLQPPDESRRMTLRTHDLCDAAVAMLFRLTDKELGILESGLFNLPRKFHVGTMCSGTDLVLFSLREVINAADAHVAPGSVTLSPMFACDSKVIAQQFIQRVHGADGPKYLFKDVCDCVKTVALCVKSNSYVPVPAVKWLIGGFSCQDVSPMNVHKVSSGDTVANKDKKTGKTFDFMMQYVAKHFPPLLTFENVPGLDDASKHSRLTNLDHVIMALESHGYVVLTVRLCPRDHGVPHRRLRSVVSHIHQYVSSQGRHCKIGDPALGHLPSQNVDVLVLDPLSGPLFLTVFMGFIPKPSLVSWQWFFWVRLTHRRPTVRGRAHRGS